VQSEATIYHNPKCSNSRGALALLQEHGMEVRIVEYLKTPPDADAIGALLEGYGGAPTDFIRFKEPAAATQGVTPESDATAIVAAIVAAPILLQRPVVILREQVIIARPPALLGPLLEECKRCAEAGE
jgi:arsenate reductase (glutaredoxin)